MFLGALWTRRRTPLSERPGGLRFNLRRCPRFGNLLAGKPVPQAFSSLLAPTPGHHGRAVLVRMRGRCRVQRLDRRGRVDTDHGPCGHGCRLAVKTGGPAPRALVANDHERRRAVAKALADVRARGFLAHRVQLVLAQFA